MSLSRQTRSAWKIWTSDPLAKARGIVQGRVAVFSVAMIRFFAFLLICANSAAAKDITVFAASSLRGPLDEVAADYGAATGGRVVISYAGSSVLARQIAQSAPADVFLSANVDWMDWLEGQREILERQDLLGNQLVLIGRAGTKGFAQEELPDHLGTDRLAMALTQAVPAGIYGKAALTHLGLWDRLQPQVVETDNVRTALALVALQETAFGITYISDAHAEPRVEVVAHFDPESHAPIIYPVAILDPNASEFYAFLGATVACDRFQNAGFTPLGACQ